jgi:hypothetical protein
MLLAWAWLSTPSTVATCAQVPEALCQKGGKWRVCCKAFNANGDTQPGSITSVWNFRGLAGNPWHYTDLAVLGRVEGA